MLQFSVHLKPHPLLHQKHYQTLFIQTNISEFFRRSQSQWFAVDHNLCKQPSLQKTEYEKMSEYHMKFGDQDSIFFILVKIFALALKTQGLISSLSHVPTTSKKFFKCSLFQITFL